MSTAPSPHHLPQYNINDRATIKRYEEKVKDWIGISEECERLREAADSALSVLGDRIEGASWDFANYAATFLKEMREHYFLRDLAKTGKRTLIEFDEKMVGIISDEKAAFSEKLRSDEGIQKSLDDLLTEFDTEFSQLYEFLHDHVFAYLETEILPMRVTLERINDELQQRKIRNFMDHRVNIDPNLYQEEISDFLNGTVIGWLNCWEMAYNSSSEFKGVDTLIQSMFFETILDFAQYLVTSIKKNIDCLTGRGLTNEHFPFFIDTLDLEFDSVKKAYSVIVTIADGPRMMKLAGTRKHGRDEDLEHCTRCGQVFI